MSGLEPASITLRINGHDRQVQVEPRKMLSDVLREDCSLTGTHVGCEHGVCGACTVLIDGRASRSCLVYAIQMSGHEITTIEGIALNGKLSPVQEALHEAHGLQCGFCTPGIVVTMEAWLAEHPNPTDAEIREALSGNLCRCTGYHNIVTAIAMVAARRRGAEQNTPQNPQEAGE